MLKQINVKIDEVQKRAAYHAMVNSGRHMTEVMREALQREIIREKIVDVDEKVLDLALQFAPEGWNADQVHQLAVELQLTAEIGIGDWT